MTTRVILVGIGGASCSGKTTLASQLSQLIPGCAVLRQDDFWTPSDQVPIHPIYGIPDADDPPGAIDWPRFREEFKRFRSNQPFADDHPKSGESSISSLSFGPVLPDNLLSEWRSRFREVERVRMRQGVKIEWRIVEGFLLYYEPEITQALDLSMFLRSPERVLKRRRQEREYVCSGSIFIYSYTG
ncbi:ribosylnicotinamide kinase [Ceratobasidium sp. 394]|nr:ribosylnicotinamide kinase [Ceratobasidium sp. 394]